MALEAVHGGEHRDRRSRPQSQSSRTEGAAPPPAELERVIGERFIRAFAHGRAHPVLDDSNHLLYIQLLDRSSDLVIQEIPAQEIASNDYHGVLVDVET